jgi:hypothetical protein
MLRGLPLSQSSQQMYQQQPSALSQVAGLAPVAYGLSRMAGYAKGGITGDANVSSLLNKLNDPQLEQARQQAEQNRDEKRVKEIEGIQRARESARDGISAAAPQQEQESQSGIASAASDSMMDRMLPTEASMARGGIVAFAEPTEDNNYSLVDAGGDAGAALDAAKAKEAAVLQGVRGLGVAFRNRNPEQYEATLGALEQAKAERKDAEEAYNAYMQTRPESKGFTTYDIAGARQQARARAANLPTADGIQTVAPVDGAPAGAPSEGVSGPTARAALPPDISTMGGSAGVGGAGVGSGSTDFGKMFDATRARMEKSADPYAEETRKLGEEGVTQMRDKKARLVADQAKQTNVFSERKGQLEDRAKAIGKREAFNEGMAFISMGAAMMTEPGNIGKVLGKGIKVGSEQYIAGMDKIERSKELLADSKEKLADLERDRSDMSLREIRAAEDDIGTAQLNAKKMLLQGRKDLGVRNDAKSLAVFESEVKQQLAREAQRAAAATANKPGEMERMMGQLGAIQSGKASFAGKTGEEGARAYKDSMGEYGAAKYGARYTGPDKGTTNALALGKLMQGDKTIQMLEASNVLLRNKTDKASQAKLAANNAEIETIRTRYRAAMPGSGASGGAGRASDKPSQEAFMTAARKANPGYTDAEIMAQYNSTYN